MQPTFLKFFFFLILVQLLAACGEEAPREQADQQPPMRGGFSVAMLLPGSADDQSWNTTGYNGLKLIEKKLGAAVSYTENVPSPDMQRIFERYAHQGYDLVIGHGGQFVVAAEKVAVRFPRTNFMVVGTDAGNNINLGTVQFIQEELGFLAGAVAALSTTSGEVAYVSGMPYPHMNKKGAAFVAGARHVNPALTARSVTLNSWTDPDRGMACGCKLINQGVDVIAVDADSAGMPIHSLARDAGVHTLGWATDQYQLAPDVMLTSGVQDASAIILAGAELVRLGRWEGKHYKFGLKDGVQGLAPFRGALDSMAENEFSRLRLDILEGRIDPVALTAQLLPDDCP